MGNRVPLVRPFRRRRKEKSLPLLGTKSGLLATFIEPRPITKPLCNLRKEKALISLVRLIAQRSTWNGICFCSSSEHL